MQERHGPPGESAMIRTRPATPEYREGFDRIDWSGNHRGDDELPEATVQYFEFGHGGPGWYWWETECVEEGSCGPVDTREQAEQSVREGDCRVTRVFGPGERRPV